jgi:hypothetical protein
MFGWFSGGARVADIKSAAMSAVRAKRTFAKVVAIAQLSKMHSLRQDLTAALI